jgi:predicted peptidase
VVLISLVGRFTVSAQDTSLFKRELFISNADTLRYRILYPDNYDPKLKYPLIVVLHGSGEKGRDNAAQLIHGAALFVKDSIRKNFPAIVVFPQCPPNQSWNTISSKMVDGKREITIATKNKPSLPARLLMELIKDLRKRSEVDRKRIYIGGLSMGGFGTFEMLRRKPKWFAAAFPICGGDNPANAKKYYRKVSLWIFHGGQDPVVNVQFSNQIAERLKALHADMKYTVYPNVKHDSWVNAFNEPDLLPWLFSKHK